MFSLHETTRRRLCRAAFLACCVVPTCAVLAWCAFIYTPHYRRAHERAVTAALGWQARLGCASTPRPGLVLYEWLELADPQSGALVARLPFVEIDTSGTAIEIRLPHPATIDGARLDALVKLADDLARRSADAHPVRFEAQNLTLRLEAGDQTFTDVWGEVGAEQGIARLAFCRATAGDTRPEPCLVVVGPSHKKSTSRAIHLTTGAMGLHAALVAPFWPGAAELGRSCEFAGRITASHARGAWTAELEGRLTNVDLDVLVSRRFPHKLTGTADVQLDALVVRAGRIETAQGRVTAGPGVVSRSLVQAAETHLHVRAAEGAIAGPGNVIAYDELGLSFEIGPQGLALRGAVPRARGAILIDDRYILAAEPAIASQPVVDLVRTLVPQSDVQVPATRETAPLTDALPVPTIALKPGSEKPLPNVRALNVNPLRSEKTIRR
jgi:hypothetical protein